RDRRQAGARRARRRLVRDRLRRRDRRGARDRPDRRGPAAPAVRARAGRQPRRRVRAGVGDRDGEDRHAGDRARGARLHQVSAGRPRALRRLGEAGERRRAARARGPRRRARRRRLARPRILHGDLSRSHPLVALVILDGWGCAPPGPGNAVELADTPNFDRLWCTYPHTTLNASGEAVGLPPGQMGNSEVGHLTIGSGPVLFQDVRRVNEAIEDGTFFESPILKAAFERGERTHLLGLVSYGGVHSHIDHLRALLTFAPERTWIHAFTDGRDVSPHSAVDDL